MSEKPISNELTGCPITGKVGNKENAPGKLPEGSVISVTKEQPIFSVFKPDRTPVKLLGTGYVEGEPVCAFSMADNNVADLLVARMDADQILIAYKAYEQEGRDTVFEMPPVGLIIGMDTHGWYQMKNEWPEVVMKQGTKARPIELTPMGDAKALPEKYVAAAGTPPRFFDMYAQIALKSGAVASTPTKHPRIIGAYGLEPDDSLRDVDLADLSQAHFLNSLSGPDDVVQIEGMEGAKGIGKKLAEGDPAAGALVAKQYAGLAKSPSFSELVKKLDATEGGFIFPISRIAHDCQMLTAALPDKAVIQRDFNSTNGFDCESYGSGAVMQALSPAGALLILQPNPGYSMVVFVGDSEGTPKGIAVARWLGPSSKGDPVWKPTVFGDIGAKLHILPFGKSALDAMLHANGTRGKGPATPAPVSPHSHKTP